MGRKLKNRQQKHKGYESNDNTKKYWFNAQETAACGRYGAENETIRGFADFGIYTKVSGFPAF